MERIGELLSELPKEYVRVVVQILTADSWNRLDRDVNFYQLGLGIGKIIDKVERETLKLLIKSCEYYQSLCRGIAKGMEEFEVSKELLLYLGNLSEIMAMEILANLELYRFPDVTEKLTLIVSPLKHVPNVGSNIARQFDKFPLESRKKIIDMLKDNIMFLYEFLQSVNLSKLDDLEEFLCKSKEIDEIIGYRLYEVNDKMKEKLLNYPNIAFGVGKGFQNLSYYWKRKVMEKVKEDKEFAKGFLSTIDFSSLEDEFMGVLIEIGRQGDLARVLGKNLGGTFPYLTEDLKTVSLNMAEKNSDFAYGFGEGISEALSSFSNFIRGKIYELRKEDQDKILNLAFNSEHFAKGFLTILNSLFFFEDRDKVLELIIKYKEYLPTFVEQFGRRLNEFNLSKLLSLKGKIGTELGKTLCRNFSNLKRENKELILRWVNENEDLKEGFLEC